MTLRALELHSEPYGSTGNIGENFRRLLGAPSLDPLQTVVREALQNVADAAKPGSGPEALIRVRELSREQRQTLSHHVFADLPSESLPLCQLQQVLSGDRLVVLEVCDFGTVGLGGPTRSDRIPVGTERTDFINFLRNIGTPRDTDQGGGTYGFGKVALYQASACSTIIVDTVPSTGGNEGRRLMACHVGRSFETPESGMLRRFTGRHWWGVRDPTDGVVDPVTGMQAAQLAKSLGLPDRTDGETGTSIMILGFEPEERDLVRIAMRIVEIVLWNFWPRMMSDVAGSRRFACRVMANDIDVPVPQPEAHAPFDIFCKAMRAVRAGGGSDVRQIRSQRPAKLLGTLALEKGLRSHRRHLAIEEERLVPEQLHHIALMRPVELVVKYLVGNPHPDSRLEWAGVFLASDAHDVERAFADSEPPAHDDWIPDNLPKGSAKRFVNIALARLREVASEYGHDVVGRTPVGSEGPHLARVAGRLGAVLSDVSADGAKKVLRPRGRSGVRPRHARATQPVFVRLEPGPMGPVAIFATEVIQDADRSGDVLVVAASISVEGSGLGAAVDAPQVPEVLTVADLNTGEAAQGGEFMLAGRAGWFEIAIRIPDECAVTACVEVVANKAR